MSRRLALCPDPDHCILERIEVEFAIPVAMTQDQQRRLLEIIDEITDSPWNQLTEGLHWMSDVGCKPKWSVADCRVLGIKPDVDAPETGEPTYDDSIFHIGTHARPFMSSEERERVLKRREAANAEA